MFDGGDGLRQANQFDLERKYGPNHDPNQQPPRERGDKWVVLGVITGVILGIVLACTLGVLLHWAFFTILFSSMGGAIVIGGAGAVVGERIRKQRLLKEVQPKPVL
jgi:hypothetical protein